MEPFDVTLTRVRRLSESTLDFRFTRDDGNIEFEPGQFFRFTFEDEAGEFERSYSLCNFGEDVFGTPHLDLVISWVDEGRASKFLFGAEAGVKARVTGPYGRLVLPQPLPKRLFLVATSVGIAPYMPMLTQLDEPLRRGDAEVWFVFGARDPSEFIYADELTGYAEAHERFHLAMCYSREMPSSPREFEHEGHVQDFLFDMTLDAEDDFVMLCGNPKMIDDVFARLKPMGFTGKRVIREKYVFARETGATKKKEMTDQQKKVLAEKMKKYQS